MWYQDVWGWVSGAIGILSLGIAAVALVWSIYAWKHTWKEILLERKLREQLFNIDLTKEGSFAALHKLCSELLELDPDMENPFEAAFRKHEKYVKKHPEETTGKLNIITIGWVIFNMAKSMKQFETSDKPEDK